MGFFLWVFCLLFTQRINCLHPFITLSRDCYQGRYLLYIILWVFILGIFFVLPCIETYTKVDLRTGVFDIPPQEVSFYLETSRNVIADCCTENPCKKIKTQFLQ